MKQQPEKLPDAEVVIEVLDRLARELNLQDGCGADIAPWRCGELMPVGSVALCERCATEVFERLAKIDDRHTPSREPSP